MYTLLRNYMHKHKIDLIYFDDPSTIAYFTDYISDPIERIMALLVTPKKTLLFTPALEIEDAKKVGKADDFIGYLDNENPWAKINQWVSEIYGDHAIDLGVDKTHLTVERLESLKDNLNINQIVSAGDIVNDLRMIKTDEEIQKLHQSGQLADQALQIGIDALKIGITEQEVVAIIEYEMKKLGVSQMSFPTMVLFGDHAASPHGEPGDRQLKANEFVLFDLGVIYNGYASDMTRTIAFGEVSSEQQAIYRIVLEAQKNAETKAHIGMLAKDLDKSARDVIDHAGYGKYFTHRLGHGIGQTAHEFPSLHGENDQELKAGMCFSIEPGIYIPEEVGIRIEDCYVLTEDGAKSFTHFPKNFTAIPVK